LADGEQVEIRPLRYGDRFELAAAFTRLAPQSRRSRFFETHDQLRPGELEYLTNIDYREHFACIARLPGRPLPNGVGVGRYVRDAVDPSVAEVAVVVVDAHQRRGIGTLLTRTLGERAVRLGIRTFVCYVQWDNEVTIDMLTAEGARVLPAEPGVARIELDLPARVDDVADTDLHRVIAAFARHVCKARVCQRRHMV
jgi:GNAT superfamily N-acetyltransferase